MFGELVDVGIVGEEERRKVVPRAGLSGLRWREGELSGDVPWQQLLDALDRVLADASQHVAQVGFWIEAVQPRRSYQTIEDSGTASSSVRASEQVITSADGNRTQSAFGDQVVQLDAAIIEVACEGVPEPQRIVDGCGRLGLRRQLCQSLFQPSPHVVE